MEIIQNAKALEVASLTAKTQADGAVTIALNGNKRYQVSIDGSGTGTVAIDVIPYGKSSYEVLRNEFGSQATLDVANPWTLIIDQRITSIKFTPTSIGANYSIFVTGE